MVPAYLDELPVIPTMTSGKADRAKLPPPTARRTADGQAQVPPATEIETALADALVSALHLDQVSVHSHFFDDLGANSLLLAHFCARARQCPGLPPLSMKDVYLHPTLRTLASALETTSTLTAARRQPDLSSGDEATRIGTARYLLCGLAQLALLAAGLFGVGSAAVLGVRWIWPAPDLVELYVRSLQVTTVALAGLCVLPVLAKWVLIGRWQPSEIRIWSIDYLRFWTVKTLIRANPLALFAGSPLYLMYLRALGAKIGRRVVILSRTVPVCTDLLTIGANTVVRKGCSFTGYRAVNGMIVTGSITIGANAVVGNASQVVNAVLGIPLPIAIGAWAARRSSALTQLARVGFSGLARQLVFLAPLELSAAMLFGGSLIGLALVVTLPRLLRPLAAAGVVYPLYGFAWWAHRLIARITAAAFFINLYGDSSYIVGFLRALGYRIDRGGQTGSNFGAALSHETPYLVHIGAGTMVADGVDFLTAEFSHTSFVPTSIRLGSNSYLGNTIAVPGGGRLGENCLVGTKTMIPIDGPVRSDVGLLGSPAFEIPRTTLRSDYAGLQPVEFHGRLRAKNAHNLRTMMIFMVARWLRVYLAMLVAMLAMAFYRQLGLLTPAIFAVLAATVDLAVSVLVERAATAFRGLQPRYCSIYDRYFWWHERFWKLSSQPTLLNGTPLKPLVWRLLGVHVGRRVFDDGASISEKTLVSIGDDATINAGSTLQAHSMEDGVFKSDWITIGARVTLGPSAFVHYGVTIGDRACISADAFLMKGEQVPSGTHWQGNPAGQIG